MDRAGPDIQNAQCPKCGGTLEPGWIAARSGGRIRFVPASQGWKRIFGGRTLAPFNFMVPTLAARYCASCGYGTFHAGRSTYEDDGPPLSGSLGSWFPES
jgi:ribosomal protein S27AE